MVVVAGYTAIPTSTSSTSSSPRLHSTIDLAEETQEVYEEKYLTAGWKKKTLLLLPLLLLLLVAGSLASLTFAATKAKGYQLEDDILLITKTGSATLHSRLPIHLYHQAQSKWYIPNKFYVSDHATTLGNIRFFNALSSLSPSITQDPEYSSLYSQLVSVISTNAVETLDKDVGWKLDKYKFLPMISQALHLYPKVKWMVVVEADTFVFWPQLVSFLSSLDSADQLLLGHGTWTSYSNVSTEFVHGGSGFVLSSALLAASFGVNPDFAKDHENLVRKSAFGDAALSKALYDTPGVHLKGLSEEGGKRFNSDPPNVLKFDRDNWCDEVLSFHHVSNADVSRLYEFEQRMAGKRVLWSDIWEEFRPGFIKEGEMVEKGSWQSFESWDSETTDLTIGSTAECKEACAREEGCLMWEYRQDTRKCRWTSEFLRIGTAKPHEKNLVTGWMTNNIHHWAKQRACSHA